MRGEKWEKKEREKEKEREKIFALLGKFLLSYDNHLFKGNPKFTLEAKIFFLSPQKKHKINIV